MMVHGTAELQRIVPKPCSRAVRAGWRLGAGLAAAITVLSGGVPFARGAEIPSDTRPLRRTRTVEVFETWKNSVVFVTGPVVKTGKGSTEEFFATEQGPVKERSVGTGFVIHESGYVLTNAHGVERTFAHTVVLADGKAYPAEPVAVIHEQDLALLKVLGGRPLVPVRLARSGDLMIGETVIVIGHPHGLLHTCTTGVLSAIGRTSHLSDVPGVTLQDLIQSDAGINPGSSGGPWFNVAGEVLGMTASMKKEAENIAFAIPVSVLRRFLPTMLDVERRYGFVCGVAVRADGACEVIDVRLDSPAAQAGLRPRDILQHLDEQPLRTGLDYHLAMVGRKPAEAVTLEWLREGKRITGTVKLAPRPTPDVKAILAQKLGLEAAPLDPAVAKAMGLRVARGLVVRAIAPSHYGQVEHPPQPGDILARIGSIRPRNPEQAALLVEDLQPGQAVDLVFVRRRDNVATRIDIHLVLPK